METFNKRYDDVYCPAIQQAGLRPYRVDRDPSVKIPIENIERKIKDAVICFADISTNNPNVWYELGYAFASKKDVVMVCNNECVNFPFDVRHKSIIQYSTDSKSDFETLEKKITEKLTALLENQTASVPYLSIPVQETQGLQPFETTMLAIIIGEQMTGFDSAPVYQISQQMHNAGFTDAATSIAIRLLRNKGFIECIDEEDWNGNQYNTCRLTPMGEQFILSNLQLFEFYLNKNKTPTSNESNKLPY